MFKRMPMTLDEIVEEVRRWPQEQVTELVDRLASTMHTDEPAVEEAWKRETRQRVAEIDSGAVRGIPGEEVSARIRRIVGR
jgi:putative addiction module component (TIGR02574 family)